MHGTSLNGNQRLKFYSFCLFPYEGKRINRNCSLSEFLISEMETILVCVALNNLSALFVCFSWWCGFVNLFIWLTVTTYFSFLVVSITVLNYCLYPACSWWHLRDSGLSWPALIPVLMFIFSGNKLCLPLCCSITGLKAPPLSTLLFTLHGSSVYADPSCHIF